MRDGQGQFRLGEHLYFFEDKKHEANIYDIASGKYDDKFVRSTMDNPNLGFSNSTYWVMFRLDNQTTSEDEFLLEVNYSLLDSVGFFYKTESGWVRELGGDMLPFIARKIKNRHLVFPMRVKPASQQVFYLRINSERGVIQFPMTVWSQLGFQDHNHQSQFIFGIIYGLILLIIINNLFLYFSIWERSYLYYVMSMISSLLVIVTLNGHGFEYLWPSSTWIQNHALMPLGLMVGLFTIIFCRRFLDTPKYVPQLDKLVPYIMGLGGITFLFSIFASYDIAFRLIFGFVALESVFLLTMSVLTMLRGNQSGKYFTTAFGVYMLGILVSLMRSMDLVPLNFVVEYSVQFGNAIQVILISFALGVKMKQLQLDKASAQEKALELQKNINDKLERKVKQRTEEIEQKAEELQKAYKNVGILSKIGQEITASLDFEDIFEMLYRYVHELVESPIFGISFYHGNKQVLEYRYYIENDQRLPIISVPITEEASRSSLSIWVIQNNRPLLLNDINNEYHNYVKELKAVKGGMPNAMISIPLNAGGKLLGLVSVQSFNHNAYSRTDFEVMQTLASYTAIALDNANVYEEIRETTTKVMQSIQYAKRIQEAILAGPQELSREFAEAFVFYQPRDIISGDIYWFYQDDTYDIIAAIDCTGHGVPGAFMTMMANDLLNQVIVEDKSKDPGEILKKIDERVGATFRAEDENDRRNDGMDISICTILKESKTLQFAGAKLPLLFIHNGELKNIKGSKFPIGDHSHFKVEKTYPTHELVYEEGDVFYLFSDGFQDQFGGPNNQKYMIRRFRKYLHSISGLPLQEQRHHLEEEFDKWRGTNKQTDDVLVMGIRL